MPAAAGAEAGMNFAAPVGSATQTDRALQTIGEWLARNQPAIQLVQWAIIAAYAVLVAVPAFLPLPDRTAHLWSNLTLFAQFVFWGLWWPFVLLSMVLVGRAWCGLLCPEGAISEFVSARGHGLATPRWIKWKGWPFAAFALTTIYGQMVSVYQYPAPVLVVLGGSTAGAIVVGYLYGRNKRVWCRFLCPVNGVFGLLAKLAPVHFRVDQDAWRAAPRHSTGQAHHVNCAPLVPIRTMRGASACHMCGRCSGFKGAIALARRSPMQEIVDVAGNETRPWETVLILAGLMGIAAGAFHWTSSDLYIAIKQFLADGLLALGLVWPLEPVLSWWLLTNYPAQNDMLSPLDGLVLVGYILAAGVLIGGGAALCLAVAARIARGSWRLFHHLAQGLIPLAACGVFLGLSAITVTMLRGEGFALAFVDPLRAALLAGASLWSAWFGWLILGRKTHGLLRVAALAPYLGGVAIGTASWALLFWPL
jgi:polyferredoxin